VSRFEIDPARSRVWTDARSNVHPIHSNTSGLEGWMDLTFAKTGRIDLRRAAAGELSLPVKRLRSGNPLQDRELHRRLDARRHPTIEGVLTSIEAGTEPGRYRVSGELTFLGVTRSHADEMTFRLDDDGTLRAEGESTFDVRDFGLEPPRILVLRVEPEVRVRIALVATATS